MGCGTSESVAVINVRPGPTQDNNATTLTLPSLTVEHQIKSREINAATLTTAKSATQIMPKLKFNPLIPLTPLTKFQMSATDSGVSSKNDEENESLDFDEDVKTETSASSDSEFEYDDQDYKNIITENSRPDLKERVEKNFMDRNGLG